MLLLVEVGVSGGISVEMGRKHSEELVIHLNVIVNQEEDAALVYHAAATRIKWVRLLQCE